jgi:hypothetical protein
MNRIAKLTIAGGVLGGAIVLVGAASAVQGGGDGSEPNENETSITGPALVRASAVALAHTGEGTVTETEVGDEESYYEVEVTLGNGSEVDVQLDENFAVVDAATDGATDY